MTVPCLLPAPFVFLARVAAQTTRIRLETGMVTLPLIDDARHGAAAPKSNRPLVVALAS